MLFLGFPPDAGLERLFLLLLIGNKLLKALNLLVQSPVLLAQRINRLLQVDIDRNVTVFGGAPAIGSHSAFD